MWVSSRVFGAVALESIAMRVDVGSGERVVLGLGRLALVMAWVLGHFVSHEVGTAAATFNSKWLLLRLFGCH